MQYRIIIQPFFQKLQICHKKFPSLNGRFKNYYDVRKTKFFSSSSRNYTWADFRRPENEKASITSTGAAINQYILKLIEKRSAQFYATAAAAPKISALDFNKASKEFFKIDMVHLKEAPLPAFWVGFAGLLPFVFPPVQSLLFGYSHFLAATQLAYGTALLGCLGGIKWGYLVGAGKKEDQTWENYLLSVVPCVVSAMSIVSPGPVGYLLIIFGFLAAFIIDLTSSNYPRWFLALRGVLTNVSIFFLLISLIQSLLH